MQTTHWNIMEKSLTPDPDLHTLKTIHKSISEAKPVTAVSLPPLTEEMPNPQADELSKLREDLAFASSTVAEIKDRIRNIETEVQRAERQRLVDHIQKRGISIEALLRDLGVRFPAMLPTQTTEEPKPEKEKAPSKYFNPANSSDVWSGRGAEPAWATPFNITPEGVTKRVYKDEIKIKL